MLALPSSCLFEAGVTTFHVTKLGGVDTTASVDNHGLYPMVQELMVEDEPDEPAGYARVIQQRVDPNHLVVRIVGPETNAPLPATHAPPDAPGDDHRSRLSEGPLALCLQERAQIVGLAHGPSDSPSRSRGGGGQSPYERHQTLVCAAGR